MHLIVGINPQTRSVNEKVEAETWPPTLMQHSINLFKLDRDLHEHNDVGLANATLP